MAYVEGVYLERTNLQNVAGLDRLQVGVLHKPAPAELGFDQTYGQRGAVNRGVNSL